MNTLQTIVAAKRRIVAERKSLFPVRLLERSIYFETPTVSLRRYLRRPDLSGIIAEFKRKSPSRGYINRYASATDVTLSYMQAGASALSVLTDEEFFGGADKDLTAARKFNYCPVLRKDFIVDEYQVIEAKSIGADAILLIAEMLSAAEIDALAKQAESLGLEVLFEVHAPGSLEKISPAVQLIGVNNRNLETFTTDVQRSFELAEKIPPQFVKVAESGIDNPETIIQLRETGYEGFLIGEAFMRHADPGKACRQFIQSLNRLRSNSSKMLINV